MRNKIIAGNWKMNLSLSNAKELTTEVVKKVQALKLSKEVKVVFGPSAPYLESVVSLIPKSAKENVSVSAQNCHEAEKGAYTGEMAASMIKEIGCEYVILGHSERRKYFLENNSLLKEKVDRALNAGLKVIFCCGETLEEREANKQFVVSQFQLENTVFKLTEKEFKNIVIAYEPVWAIGTGKTASPEQAEEIHKFIRKITADKFGKEVADELTILYGGSVKPANAKELFSKPNVDGGLIGGASLKSDDFISIIKEIL